jgi:hypothetical protein
MYLLSLAVCKSTVEYLPLHLLLCGTSTSPEASFIGRRGTLNSSIEGLIIYA